MLDLRISRYGYSVVSSVINNYYVVRTVIKLVTHTKILCSCQFLV